MKPILALWIAMTCIGIPLFVSAQDSYYVDPIKGSDKNNGTSIGNAFRSISKARDVVRTVNRSMTGDIIIYLKGGIHRLYSTFTLLSRDGGTNGHSIIYQAYNCEKPVISGGIKITKWVLHDAVKNIYKTTVIGQPMIDSRQLYVNGVRATRARSIDASGWNENGDGYDCPAEVSKWKNISNVEVVSYMIWKCHRGPVASVSGTHVKMAPNYWEYLHAQYDAPPAWIENAYELLDEEGEWYLDRPTSTVYYKPRKGEHMVSAEVYLSKLETLMNCSGVSNVEFRGITFEHATWLTPNTASGFACLQADARISGLTDQIYTQMPGNISFNYCTNIKITSCVFDHLGSTALQLSAGCKNNSIYNNTFTDISGSAISIGSLSDSFPSTKDLVKDNTVDNNLISNVAVEFRGCVGIITGYTDHTVIIHNELHNLPYTGISIGWGWSNTETVAKNNEISYNLIDSVLTLLQDGAAIYTLSAQRGTTIHHNYIRNQFNEGSALYTDEGSSYMHLHHNVLENIHRWINLWSVTSLNVAVDFNYYNNSTNIFSGTNCTLQDNVFIENNNWLPDAAYIMNSAGRVSVAKCNYSVPPVDELAGLKIYVYPNPTPSVLHVLIDKPLLENYTIRLYDFQGRLLQTTQQDKSQLLSDLYLSNYASGMYLVRVTAGTYIHLSKVFKQ